MTPVKRLSLYHRRGCHLCDEMLEAVEQQLTGLDIAVDMIDIDTDLALASRYGSDIPVLVAGSLEICRHRLDTDRLREWLSSD